MFKGWGVFLLAAFFVVLEQPTESYADPKQPVGQEAVPDTGSIATGLFNLRYRIEGTGTPTIVIGFPTYYARVFSQNLRSHLRLVFLDHRGTATSPGKVDTTEFALEKLLDDIELARRTLRLGRIAVIGHSGHGFIALEYAKKYAANVSHVIMIGVAPDFSAASAEATEKNWLRLASQERKAVMDKNLKRTPDEQLAKLPPEQAFIRRYVRNGPRTWYNPRFDASSLFEGVVVNMDMISYVWGTIFRDIDITVGLHTFDRPVFLALGRYDFLVAPPSMWDSIKPMFQNLTMRVFERSGHTPQYEETDHFDEELLRWMGQHQE
jgi:proline iminopeptidase